MNIEKEREVNKVAYQVVNHKGEPIIRDDIGLCIFPDTYSALLYISENQEILEYNPDWHIQKIIIGIIEEEIDLRERQKSC